MKSVQLHFRAARSLCQRSRAGTAPAEAMKDERLTDAQVLRICRRLEEKYGYRPGEHQRVIVEHVKDGRQHFHVMWHRVSLGSGQLVWPGHHWKKSRQAAREMEVELGLKRPTPRRVRMKKSVANSGKPVAQSPANGAVKPTTPILHSPRRPCAVRPAPRPRRRPIRRPRHHASEDQTIEPALAINPQMSHQELIAWAWDNNRFDILAQFGIYVSPDP